MKRELSHGTSPHRVAVRIQESTLVDICDLLEANTIEVVDTEVTFTKVLPTSDRQTWRGEFGHWVVADGFGWSVLPDAKPAEWARSA